MLAPWRHQVDAAQLARDGRHVVVATGTASGKSLAYQLPALTRLAEDPRACVLYLAPTKALARDQLAVGRRARRSVGAPGGLRRGHPGRGTGLGPAALALDRHQPGHAAPRDPARAPEVVEHPAPGRLRRHRRVPRLPRGVRLARRARAAPAPADLPPLRRGAGVRAGLGHGRRARGRRDAAGGRARRGGHRRRLAPPRRHVRAVGAAADRAHRRARRTAATLGRRRRRRDCWPTWSSAAPAPWRSSGRGAARSRWPSRPGGCCTTAAATTWCAGWTPTAAATCPRNGGSWSGRCRPATCWASRRPTPSSSASTSRGWTRSCWPATRGRSPRCGSRPGRAGRAQKESLVVFVARDDPLDHYLAHHPRAVFGRPIEATVTDPTNPYVLGPQLCCAAAELPLPAGGPPRLRRGRRPRPSSRSSWPPASCAAGPPAGTGPGEDGPTSTSAGAAEQPVSIIEAATGRLLGTVDGDAAHSTVHDGALYVHRGDTFVVDEFDVDDACAVVHAGEPGVDDRRPRRHRPLHRLDRADPRARRGHRAHRRGRRDQPGGGLPAAAAGHRRGAGRVPAGPAGPAAAHARGLADVRRPGGRAGRGRRGRAARLAARGGARRDRHPPAAGDLRPLGPRRPLDRAAPRHRDGDDLRLRRAPGRRRLQRARVRGAPALAAGDAGDRRQLRVRERLPLLRAVAQVRQRQRPARQGRGGAGPRRRPRRARGRRGPAGRRAPTEDDPGR